MPSPPKYMKLYEQLKSEISDGAYPLGHLMPTEDQLCESYNVSRYALREAMARLESEGMIKRRRGSGSRVISLVANSSARHAVASREDLMNYASSTRMDWQSQTRVRTDGALARLLGCDEMREWQVLSGTRYGEDDQPLALVDLYVDPERVTIPENTDFGDQPVYRWLETHHNLVPCAVSQDIRATRLSHDQAAELKCAAEAPVLEVIRRYFDQNNTMYQISRSTYRARDFVLNFRFQLQPDQQDIPEVRH